MRFGPVPLAEAEGAILAHSVRTPAGPLRKGLELGPDAIAALAGAGHREVIVARFEAGDLHEDRAADIVARALIEAPGGQGLSPSVAATGRVNLHATGPGVLGVDAGRVHALNAVNPMITLATLPEWARVAEGQMVATVKIIAYGVPEADVARAAAAGAGAMRLWSPRMARADLIETVIDGGDASGTGVPGDKGRRALAGRLARLGVQLGPRVLVAHETGAIAAALGAAEGEAIFVLTASATSDPADVAPEALRRAGGEVVQFGIPVDPGNLLFLGRLGDRPVIGLPGCARSPALNGADWVLERVLCGVPVGPRELARMGLGGLLKEIPSRPRPRALGRGPAKGP
ncbi:MAG: molybdopterin-binding protein [Rubellimicrobium sp.]|nr:molybdopterin-binding protein [Rubellimicrobium sp.]